jgi:hypothetical protein
MHGVHAQPQVLGSLPRRQPPILVLVTLGELLEHDRSRALGDLLDDLRGEART